ncbi:MAG: hypothetical protein LBN27_02895 [Prevotellaceae bacterium]|jgi:hypothetical protein|nr:hypothetical protein [Prevotellaceae bacterium]
MAFKIKKSSRMAWGVTLIVFGVLYYCNMFIDLPKYVFDFRNYPILAGIIFLIFNQYKSPGFVMIIVGILMRFSYEMDFTRRHYDWTSSLWDYVWPPLLIIIGALMIWKIYRNDEARKKKLDTTL